MGDPIADISAPVSLGRYEILAKLGTGGMATVYLARNAGELGFQRLCAVKVLHPHLAEDTQFIQMLLDEAQIAARIHHPNVVPIVDLGTADNILYVAMEYVEGCSLSALLRKRPDERPSHLLVPIVLDTLAGLDAAHSLTDDDGNVLNLVHRDVSPQNVLVGIDGTARITDFGIARASTRMTSTRPGQLKGKLAYMSPEQIRSTPIDRRSDVFSAGAMLWSLLTGRKLFVGDSDAATMHNIMNMEVPPPSTVVPSVAPFDAVCLRALEREPDHRFSSAAEMEEALRAVATTAAALGTRREVGEWIVRSFNVELAERRKTIRAVVAGKPVERRSSSAMKVTELPSFTPSVSTADGLRPTAHLSSAARGDVDLEPTRPAPEPEISIITPPRRRRIALIAAPVALAVVVVLWLVLRSPSETPRDPAPPVPTEATPVAPSPPPVAASPTPPAELATTPTAPPPAAAAVSTPTPTRPPPAHAAATRVPVRHAPAATKPPPAPVKPPPAPPPPKPTPPQHWDPDSPVPPP